MDYIHKFDIELDRDIYYAGEKLTGHVVVQNTENLKVQGIRLTLRGKVHVEWKIMRTGERRTVKQDHYYIDDKAVVWGKDRNEEGSVPILPRGNHRYPFQFQLPESALPCSFESKMATIRYYLRVIIEMPYASSPQGIKYFTIIGPHIDCMDERYLTPQEATDKRNTCCLCCGTGPLVLKATLDRSAYCCGENIRLKAEIQNNSDENVSIVCRLMQYVVFFINKGVLGLNKDTSHKVFEVEGPTVLPYTNARIDELVQQLQVPVMPPTLINVCQNVEIYYTLKVFLRMEKTGDVLHIDFPITVGTIPFRIPNSPSPEVKYENAVGHVEGGIYISSEFQFGGVYMGDDDETPEEIVLYQPVYVCIPHVKISYSHSGLLQDDNKAKEKKKSLDIEKSASVIDEKDIPSLLEKSVMQASTDKKAVLIDKLACVNTESEACEEKSKKESGGKSESLAASAMVAATLETVKQINVDVSEHEKKNAGAKIQAEKGKTDAAGVLSNDIQLMSLDGEGKSRKGQSDEAKAKATSEVNVVDEKVSKAEDEKERQVTDNEVTLVNETNKCTNAATT